MNEEETVEVTGYVYDAETKETVPYTCRIPKPKSKPRSITFEVVRDLDNGTLQVKPTEKIYRL